MVESCKYILAVIMKNKFFENKKDKSQNPFKLYI